MPKRLYIDGLNFDLFSSTRLKLPRRKLPLETRRHLDLFRRALQLLPVRELSILFQLHVLNQQQDDISPLYEVRQGNISYHRQRAITRIKLHHAIWSLISETRFRQALIDANVPHHEIPIVLGIIKTSSQTAAAQANGTSQPKVRATWERAQRSLQRHRPNDPAAQQLHAKALALVALIRENLNQLRAFTVQSRFQYKVHGRNPNPRTPTASPPTKPATSSPNAASNARHGRKKRRHLQLDKVRAIVNANPGLEKTAMMRLVAEQMNISPVTAYKYLQDIQSAPAPTSDATPDA